MVGREKGYAGDPRALDGRQAEPQLRLCQRAEQARGAADGLLLLEPRVSSHRAAVRLRAAAEGHWLPQKFQRVGI